MYATVYGPKMEKWKMEIFPKILYEMIHSYVDKRLPKDGHIDDFNAFCDSVRKYVTGGINHEVLHYFECHCMIEPYEDQHYNHVLGIIEYTRYPADAGDIPKKYTDLASLCPELMERISTVTREVQTGRLVSKIEKITEMAKDTGQ